MSQGGDVPTGAPRSVALRVQVWNPGAPRRVLLVHGLGSDSGTVWRLAEEVAAAGATAVAPDLRNHGLSPTTHDHRVESYAADVAELADGWDLAVGHSLGGSVVASLCARPGFAARGLLLDPVLHLDDDLREPLRADLHGEVGGALTAQRLAEAQPGWSGEDRHRKLLAAALVSPRTVDRTLDHNDPWDVTADVAAWRCPVTVLAADPDRGAMLRPAQVARLAPAAPGATWDTVVGAGHSVHRDDPDAVCAVVRRLLATH